MYLFIEWEGRTAKYVALIMIMNYWSSATLLSQWVLNHMSTNMLKSFSINFEAEQDLVSYIRRANWTTA